MAAERRGCRSRFPGGRTGLLLAGLLLVWAAFRGPTTGGPGATGAASPTPPATPSAAAVTEPPTPSPSPSLEPAESASSGDPSPASSDGTASGPLPSPSVGPGVASGTALALLGLLPVRAERGAGYARSLFRLWVDADGDGCDTRREVLIAESRTTVRVGSSCRLSGGSWRSAYDGIVTTDPSTFDIDHVVPLKEAWDSGAWDWLAARRQAYANDLGDPRTLRAVSATSNRTKSDQDPADWLPMASFRCTYAEEWVAIKIRWELAVDGAERTALVAILDGCPARPIRVAIVSGGEHGGATTGGGTTGSTAAPSGCNPNYGGWCVPNSTTDLDCPDIGHRVTVIGIDVYRLDSDGDGIGCDSYPAG